MFGNQQCSGVSKMTSRFHFLSATSPETITYPNSIGSQQWTKWLMFIDCLSRGCGFHARRRHLNHDFITCPKVLRLCYPTEDEARASILGRSCVACHFLLLHTKNGRLPNAKSLDHGRTSQHLKCPLENKESENRGVVN